jgi:hydrogenase nickel incorporation protein HypB
MKFETPPAAEAMGAEAVEANRRRLRDAGVFSVSLVGGPGCGKTALLEKTIERLSPDVRVAAVLGDLRTHRDADRILRRTRQVVQVNTGGRGFLEPQDLSEALAKLDLAWADVLLIENVGSLAAPAEQRDLGQDATVTIFSVAGGDDKAEKHSDLVVASDAVVLNKTDLILLIPFDLASFRDDVRRLNPGAELFEISALTGRGMVPWLNWLRRRVRKCRREGDDSSHWFG